MWMPPWSARTCWWCLLLATCIVRGGFTLLDDDSLRADVDDYRLLASHLVNQGTFGYGEQPTAFRPPLYPLLLVAATGGGRFDPAGIALLHVAFGAATVMLTWSAGRRLGLSPEFATLAGLLVAVDPILLRQSTAVMTETAAAFVAALALWCLIRASQEASIPGWVIAGGALGAAALTRPTFLVWIALVAPVCVTRPKDVRMRLRVGAAIALLAGVAILLFPWVLRNQLRFGRPIVGTTHGGFTLLLANNASFYKHLRTQSWFTTWDAAEFNKQWAATLPRRTRHQELESQDAAYRAAWRAMRAETDMLAAAVAYRWSRLWGVLPLATVEDESPGARFARYAVAIWYIAGWLLVLRAALAMRSELFAPPWGYAVALWLALTVVHALFWTDMRMRAPAVPSLALAAAVGASVLAGRISKRKPRFTQALSTDD